MSRDLTRVSQVELISKYLTPEAKAALSAPPAQDERWEKLKAWAEHEKSFEEEFPLTTAYRSDIWKYFLDRMAALEAADAADAEEKEKQ